jgi:CheY-like chemotaxis protein
MSRILLADDSLHAQRMGERILREEGFEVVSVTDGDTALIRLADVDPDVVLADAFLPGKSGYEICRHIKANPRHRYTRVVLTAGLLESANEEEARKCGSDAFLKKPFEASAVVSTIRQLIDAARFARGLFSDQAPASAQPAADGALTTPAQPEPGIDPERVRAAITLALDAALPAMIDEITERVLVALGH